MKLLIVANIYSHHIISIISILKKQSPDFSIDVFNTNFLSYIKGFPIPHTCLYNKIINAHKRWPNFLYKIPYIRGIVANKDLIHSFYRINIKYDSVTFHQIPSFGPNTSDFFHSLSSNIIAYPFGSEVLRASSRRQKLLVKFFNNIDFCVTSVPHMIDFVKSKYGYNKSIVSLGYGSSIIDLINNSSYTKTSAKSEIGYKGKYVIVCGYNGYRGQNQLEVILQIAKIKHQLPNNYIVVVPMTYGASRKYFKEVKKALTDNQLNYQILHSFMSEKDIVLLRFAADVFIHAQETDNMASSVLEFLLCNTKMLNLSKLRYSLLEKSGPPYFLYNTFESIGETLIMAINSNAPISEELISILRDFGREKQMKLWAEFYHSLI